MPRDYYGRTSDKRGRARFKSGPHETREEAMEAAFAGDPQAKECSTSRGVGQFDIRWHKRAELSDCHD